MSALLRFVLPLIGYFCTATVLTAALAYGYGLFTGKIDDEKLFRIAAVVHDVDLSEEEVIEEEDSEIPPEEASYRDQQRVLQVATLQFDAKQKQLNDLLTNFNHQLDNLNLKTARYESFKTEVEAYLRQQQNQAQDEAMRTFVQQMETLNPRSQGKQLVELMIKDGKIDMVVRLLQEMKSRPRDNLLAAFNTPEDVELLYEIQSHMLVNNPLTELINRQIDGLEDLKSEEN